MKIQRAESAPSPEFPMVDIDERLRIPSRVLVYVEDDAARTIEISAVYSGASGRYECRELKVTAPDSTPEITGESLRSVPVATAIKDGARRVVDSIRQSHMGYKPQDITEGGPTTRALEWVAYYYQFAVLFGESPVSEVMTGLSLPRSTASRWITRARDRGLLTVQDKRGQRRAPEDGKSLD
jgi:hypothetical protein